MKRHKGLFRYLIFISILIFSFLSIVQITLAETETQNRLATSKKDQPSSANKSKQLFSMELREADLKDILRLLAQESNLNIIVSEEVVGKVTVSFKNVSLEEALNAILKTYNYSYIQDGNIIRITTEEETELITKELTINYATDASCEKDLTELAESMNKMLSGREGSNITVIKRTNTLLITDIPQNVEKIIKLAKKLDAKTPQVKIEARIVEVKDTYEKELGISWGATYSDQQSSSFPRTVTIGGDAGGTGLSGNPYAVNLPVSDPFGALGMTFGNVSNTFNLDIQLSAMEKLDKIKILSTPSILVIQNKEATIRVGEQLPYQSTTTEEGVTTTEVEWKDIAITLVVTPYITPDNSIFMTIELNKDTRGEAVVIQGVQDFSIDTKQISTKVLLKDGETAVIGGLYTQTKTQTDTGVPFLSKIPILGWLFKSKTNYDSRNELLIFLTPTIVNIP